MRRLYKPESMQYLLTTLARKKREGLGQYGKEKGKDERASTASVELLKALHWQFEKKTDETPMALQGQDLRDRRQNGLLPVVRRSHATPVKFSCSRDKMAWYGRGIPMHILYG